MRDNGKIGILPLITVAVCLVLAFFLFAKLNPEGWIKKEGKPVKLADIPAGDNGAYTGKTAGEDVPKLSGSKELEDMIGTQYESAIPKKVIKTGVYSLKPWLNPYEITNGRNNSGRIYRTGRKAAEATDSAILAVSDYIEYYLIQLPDDTYILAQFSDTYRKAIERGETVTLPLGIQKNTGKEARSYLKEICGKYGASTDYVLYAVDNEWNNEHEFTLFIIRFGISAVVFFILSFAILMAADKIRHR
ncbi:hypothetical protein [Anaerocolumna jejuensis]|uniref:hypothetical protein n=1 Tax=Anaerocolumna jejuensis TaxID=259063 RepID=UPI003F7C4F5C